LNDDEEEGSKLFKRIQLVNAAYIYIAERDHIMADRRV